MSGKSKSVTLSVIIPAYNAGKYLDDCLESVMTQTGASFEVVLVNDGSTDCTSGICKKWADRHQNIVYIEQENQGQGTARNVAIAHASGEWLVFLDADDVMFPGALGFLEGKASDEYDILVYSWVYITKDPGIVWTSMPPDTGNKEKIMRQAVSALWDKMFRRSLWEKEGIWLQNIFGEDIYPVFMLEAKAGRIRTEQIPLVCHYDRADNLTSQSDKYIQLVEAEAGTLKTFFEKGMLEEYRESLLFSLLNHHKNYCRLWKENHQREDKYIVDGLGSLAERYFPGEYKRLFAAQEEAIVIIGRFKRPFPAELEAAWVYYYECMEQYLLDGNRPVGMVCHFIINVENEVQSVIAGTRTPEWALSYWKMQCMEMLEIKESNKLNGSIFLYCEKRNEIIKRYEEAAEKIWKCIRLKNPEDIWDYVDLWNRKEMQGSNLTEKEKAQIWSPKYFNYRGECLRLDNNVRLLCTWLQLKQQGIGLEDFFVANGYYNVGIYGFGYLGKLLSNELQNSSVRVSFFIDRNTELETDCPLYSPEDILPAADVVVVSVVHQFEFIRRSVKCAARVISLQDVVDWYRKF